ncbi:RusA family crossover junction endodeoxyribonuclease [Pseudomonas putida]|uniref:RusA family crossover junction endodeoxyribonuclease n=1 Tax=Pseudomonas putida TaxID=303 RepID=UPI00235C0283|nr:RusA family crossover junction endodeoxyribonuclease [Pseudomonas putida]GLO24232.1 endonuclease [Pseudomonas putida]HDS0967694.1 RusA family crossover junction endodeoxyribonuclease [Pseudomonas putida]
MADLKPVQFLVPGEPVGKGRPRIGRVGGHARMFTPQKTASYEGLIAMAGTEAMAGRTLLEGAVMVEMRIVLAIPQSMSKKRKAQAIAGELFPTKKPDMDNVIKAIYDGLNGVVWKDDVQVVDAFVRKRYGEVPGVHVRIVPLEAAA